VGGVGGVLGGFVGGVTFGKGGEKSIPYNKIQQGGLEKKVPDHGAVH